jgi:hypothetical protein
MRPGSFGLGIAVCGVLAGCGNDYVQVRVEEPTGARAVIQKGYYTPQIETKTPFVGKFEAVSLDDADSYLVEFDLDAAAAAREGGQGPATLYGHLTVGPPTELGKTQTIVLRMPDEKMRALLSGASSEIEVFVDDPNEGGKVLARLVMRSRPF